MISPPRARPRYRLQQVWLKAVPFFNSDPQNPPTPTKPTYHAE